jgi:hypothetical protein
VWLATVAGDNELKEKCVVFHPASLAGFRINQVFGSAQSQDMFPRQDENRVILL